MTHLGIPAMTSVHADVDASPSEVWAVLADPTRVGEWSSECHSVRWLDDAQAAVPGARFQGFNRAGALRWSRVCQIRSVEPERELVWHVLPAGINRDHVEWRVSLEPVGGGTRIRQSYRLLRMPRAMEVVVAVLNRNHRDRTEALQADLRRLGRVAAGQPVDRERADEGPPALVGARSGTPCPRIRG